MKLLRRDFGKALGLLAGGKVFYDIAFAKSSIATDQSYNNWWESAVVYEIYPRSFQDSNQDGIGDFPGITKRLPYLRDLGVDALWIAACFDSPNADYGYDVRDYRNIMPEFGTLNDFDRFVLAAEQLGMRVILDMVFNHTSDEHQWFAESRRSRNSPYRDYYIWHDPVNGRAPTNWPSTYGGSGWEYDPPTQQYYFHHYSRKQPDLNWENPQVRHELYEVLKFWRNRGVSGFRFDAIGEISKPLPFRDMTLDELANTMPLRTAGQRLNEYLREMRTNALEHNHVYAVGEGWGVSRKKIQEIADDRNLELDSAFRFDFQLADVSDWHKTPWRLSQLRKFNLDNSFDDNPHVWPVVFLEDHDFPRSVSRFGSSDAKYWQRSAKLLSTMLLSLRGTPYVYMGQEIGMTNYPFRSIAEYRDVAIKNSWQENVVMGTVSAEEFLKDAAASSRDNARTPMQWDSSQNGGFSRSDKPWMAVNPNYTDINVEAQTADPESVLSYYRQMIKIRKKHDTLIYGSYVDLSPDDGNIYAYKREYNREKILIVLNFSDDDAIYFLPDNLAPKKLLISNTSGTLPDEAGKILLAPWEGNIILCH